ARFRPRSSSRRHAGLRSAPRSSFVEVGAAPLLEHEQAPQAKALVAPPLDVLVDERAQPAGIEPAACARAAVGEDVDHRLLERTAKPSADGDAEAAFGALDQPLWQEIDHCPLENRFLTRPR